MVRVNAFIEIRESSTTKELERLAIELTELSLHDRGCIDYDVYSSLTVDNHLMIVETWESREALREHQESEHFRRIVPRLKEIGTFTTEIFDF